MFDVRVFFFGSALEVRRSMFDVRVFFFRSALKVRRSMFDVRVFLPFGEAFEVRRWMFDVRVSLGFLSINAERRTEEVKLADGRRFLSLFDFLRFDVGSSAFDVRCSHFLPFGVGCSMFAFLSSSVRRWKFGVRFSSLISEPTK